MTKSIRLAAYVFPIHRAGIIGFTTISEATYRTFFQAIDASVASKMVFQSPKEFLFPPTDVISLVSKIVEALSGKKSKKCHTLLLEMLDKEADVRIYDDLCNAIDLALNDKNATQPWCISIAVSNCDAFKESVFLNHRLIPTCKRKNIGLILLSDDQKVNPSLLCRGSLPIMHELPPFQPLQQETAQQEERKQQLSPEEIAKEFQILFGHFQIKSNDTTFHVPAIASVKKLTKNERFLEQLRDDVSQMLGTTTFTICPFGILGGGMNELSFRLAHGDANRLCDAKNINEHDGNPLLLLCDFLSPVYPLDSTIGKARNRETKQIAVVGIARYQHAVEYIRVPTHFYLNTSYEAVQQDGSSCRFCAQGVEIIAEEHFDDFAREISKFDPFTFWEFIAQSKDFVKVGHWPSDRTPNHYHFRIMTDPIFKRHCYHLSLRLRNILRSKSTFLPEWLKKIVCTAGEESTTLSMELSEVLGLSQNDVVRIPRKFLASIVGKELSPDLLEHISSSYGSDALRRQNVLIVDQAAHHFKTLSALRDICEYYNCKVLAFAVFIDRTSKAFSLGDYLLNSHYVSLYSWPVSPHRGHECPCVGEQL